MLRNRWTKEDVQILKDSYEKYNGIKGIEYPLSLIERHPRCSCQTKAKNLGITKKFGTKEIDLSTWSSVDVGYLAGIIDGEGCFNIYTDKRKNLTYVRITIATTSKILADWLKEKLGRGGVNYERRNKPKPNHKQVYVFLIGSQRNVLEVLEWIRPQLIIKKDKATECINFIKSKLNE